jgi:alkylation response protein AidB-like acyl-CoA dehydrogenase
MDFTLTAEQEALADSVRRFREREYDFEARRAIITSPAGMREAHWRTFAELGWLGAGLAEDAGGYGGGPIENALILEEFGRGLIVEPFVAHVVAVEVLAALAPLAMAGPIATLIGGEERLVLAHYEAEGRGDAAHVGMRAEPDGNGFRLAGAKSLVAGGAQAGGFLVSARDGDGTSLFLVRADAAGLTRRCYRTLDNHRVADLALEGVVVDADARIGARGGAMPAVARALDHGAVAVCAEAVGAMDAALWITRDYLRTRQQFGTAIGNFQALQHRMADMLIETELSRSMLYQALAALGRGDADARAAGVSAAKVQIADAAALVGGQAIQLHGGIGVTEEHAIGHYYRRLFVIARTFGGSEVHLERYRALSFAASAREAGDTGKTALDAAA